jgi:hypothetical protein
MHFLPARLNRSGSKSVDTLASITSDSKASNGLLSPSSTQGVLSSDTSLASAPITTADEDSGLGRKIHPNPQSFIQNDGLPSPPSSPSRSRSPNGVVRSSSRPTLVASLSSNSNGTLQEEYLEGGFRPPSPKPRGLSPAPTPKKRASPPAPEMATIDSTAMKQTASAPLLGPSDWSTFGRVGITQRPSMEWATDVEMVPRPPGLFPPYSSPISDPIPSSPTFSESTVTQANLSTDIPPLASLSQSKNQYVTPPRKALSSAVRDSIDSIPSKSSPSSLETRGNRSSKSSPSSDSPQSNRSRHSLGTASGSALARLASLVGNGSPLASRRNSQDPSAASDLRPLTFGRSPERRNSLSATHVFSFVPPQPTKSNSASPDDARSIRTVTRRVSADLSAAEASAETSVSWQKGVTDEMIRLSIGRVPPPRSSIDAPDTTRPYRRSIRNSGLDEKAKAKDPSWFLDLDNPSSDVEQGIRPRKTSLPKKRTSRGKTRGQAHIKTASLPRNEAAKRDSLVFPTSKSGDVLKDTTKARANVVDPALPQEVRVQMMTSSTSAPLEKGNGNDKEPPPSDKGKDVSENIPPARTQPAPPSNVLVPPTLNFTAATPETSPLVLSNSPVTPRSHSTPTVFPSVEASSSTTPVEKRRSRRTTSGDYVDEPLSGGSLRTKRKSQDADDEHLPRIVDSAKRSNTMKSILRTPRVSAGADDVLGGTLFSSVLRPFWCLTFCALQIYQLHDSPNVSNYLCPHPRSLVANRNQTLSTVVTVVRQMEAMKRRRRRWKCRLTQWTKIVFESRQEPLV